MVTLLAVVVGFLLFTLSSLHFYWAFGGSWGFDEALPTDEQGKRVLNPGKLDSTVVGLALLVFAIYYAIIALNIPAILPNSVVQYGGWGVSLLFLLRAVGDFRYIGFFKKVRSTGFAQKDSYYFSPLCLAIGLAGIFMEWMM